MNNQEANAANLLMLWELGEAIGPYRGTLLSNLNAAVDRVAPRLQLHQGGRNEALLALRDSPTIQDQLLVHGLPERGEARVAEMETRARALRGDGKKTKVQALQQVQAAQEEKLRLPD